MKCIIPTSEQMEVILRSKLKKDFPGEQVELGENWELIAEIFFRAGFDSSINGEK